MDDRLKIVEEEKARERLKEALASQASREDARELRGIRQDGRFRGAFDLYELRKMADIAEGLESGQGSSGQSSQSKRGKKAF